MHGLKTFLLSTVFLMPGIAMAMPQVFPTGTTVYNPEKAYNGYTLLAGGPPRMVDMNGNLVNDWSVTGANAFPAKPLPNGRILSTGKRWNGLIDDGITLSLYDWNGNTEWEFRNYLEVDNDGSQPPEQKKMMVSTQHHDMQFYGTPAYYVPGAAMPTDGKVLILGHEWHTEKKINDNLLMDDILIEVDQNGKELWKWRAADHFDEYGFDAAAKASLKNWKPGNASDKEKGFDWWHQNCAAYLGPNKWYDAGDQRFHPDNIIMDSRESNILLIIDRQSGKVVWRVGPDYLNTEDANIKQIVGPHNTHMIPRGLPGESNILLYDNGGQAGYGAPTGLDPTGRMVVQRAYSRVLEFDPVTKEVVWEYSIKSHKKPWTLFAYWDYSPFISSAQRLPNGNTLVCEGSNGRFVEVTTEGEIVWEYVSPYPGNIPGTNYVYRAYRLPYDWAPQAEHAPEVAVSPKGNGNLQIPNDKGQLPSVHQVYTSGTVTKSGSSISVQKPAAAPTQEFIIEEDDPSSSNTMHSY